jgi:hypothetical protein
MDTEGSNLNHARPIPRRVQMLTSSDLKFLAACGITVHSGELRPVLSTQDVVMDAELIEVYLRNEEQGRNHVARRRAEKEASE